MTCDEWEEAPDAPPDRRARLNADRNDGRVRLSIPGTAEAWVEADAEATVAFDDVDHRERS